MSSAVRAAVPPPEGGSDAAATGTLVVHGVEVPHYHQGELIGTSRKFDERLTVALLAMRAQFAPRPVRDWEPAAAFEPDDLDPLCDRVERGPENWLDDSDLEADARFSDGA